MKKTGIRSFACYLFSAICLLASSAEASEADSLYALAQKLYSQGAFDEAAKAYGKICSQVGAKDKKICQLKEIKSLAETMKTDAAQAAQEKLLQLLSQTEPSDSLFAEMNAENAKLQTMLGQLARAARSWNEAQASANPSYFPELYVLCQDILSNFQGGELTAEVCSKIKPADTSLISLPRKKVAPLSGQPAAKAPAAPAAASQSPKWCVQLGAFGNKENAEKLVADFKQRGVQLHIAETADKKLFTVRAGNFSSAEEARSFAEQKIEPAHKDYKVFQN